MFYLSFNIHGKTLNKLKLSNLKIKIKVSKNKFSTFNSINVTDEQLRDQMRGPRNKSLNLNNFIA